jgi:hypothetical protein
MREPDQSNMTKVECICQDRQIYGFDVSAPRIKLSRMLRTHGYKDLDTVPKKVLEEAARARKNAEIHARPKSFYRILTIDTLADGKLALRKGPELTCAAFDHHLKDCSQVCLFVTTLGPVLDEKIKECMDDVSFQPLEALFLGTYGWLMIEATTRNLMQKLKASMAEKGQTLTFRLGPGYSYRLPGVLERSRWELTDQAALLNAFESINLPVSLTEGFSMRPAMTRSGLAGLKYLTNKWAQALSTPAT